MSNASEICQQVSAPMRHIVWGETVSGWCGLMPYASHDPTKDVKTLYHTTDLARAALMLKHLPELTTRDHGSWVEVYDSCRYHVGETADCQECRRWATRIRTPLERAARDHAGVCLAWLPDEGRWSTLGEMAQREADARRAYTKRVALFAPGIPLEAAKMVARYADTSPGGRWPRHTVEEGPDPHPQVWVVHDTLCPTHGKVDIWRCPECDRVPGMPVGGAGCLDVDTWTPPKKGRAKTKVTARPTSNAFIKELHVARAREEDAVGILHEVVALQWARGLDPVAVIRSFEWVDVVPISRIFEWGGERFGLHALPEKSGKTVLGYKATHLDSGMSAPYTAVQAYLSGSADEKVEAEKVVRRALDRLPDEQRVGFSQLKQRFLQQHCPWWVEEA